MSARTDNHRSGHRKTLLDAKTFQNYSCIGIGRTSDPQCQFSNYKKGVFKIFVGLMGH